MRRGVLVGACAALAACGRSGFVAAPGGSGAGLTVAISAPSTTVIGCPAPLHLQVQNGSGPVAGAFQVDVGADLSQILLTSGSAFTLGRSVRVTTGPAGSVDLALVYEGTGSAPLQDTVSARTVGGSSASSAGLQYIADTAPSLTRQISVGGELLPIPAESAVPLSVTAGTAVNFTVVVNAPGQTVDPTRVRWASDSPEGSAMDPIAGDLDGTPGGINVRLPVSLGPHLLYAEYVDCAGLGAHTVFRIEGGTRVATRRTTADGLAANGVAKIEVDRSNGDGLWVGYSTNQKADYLTDGSNGGPNVAGAGNPSASAFSFRWAGSTLFWASFNGQNGVFQYDSSNAGGSPTTSLTAAPFDHPFKFTSPCNVGEAYGLRTTTNEVHRYAAGAAAFTPNPLDQLSMSAMAARQRPGGKCGLMAGGTATAYSVTYFLATNDNYSASKNPGVGWDPPTPISAIGFVDPEAWIAAGDGLYLIPDPEAASVKPFLSVNHAQKVFGQATGIPADSLFPEGFNLGGITRLEGGRNGSLGQLWIANSSPGADQEGLIRLVEITPRDAAGRRSAPLLLAAPLEEPLLRTGVNDLGVLRQFDGTVSTFPVWAATGNGVVHVTWR